MILTGLFARTKLMTAIPENLRHMLGTFLTFRVRKVLLFQGNETTRLGVNRFWQLIQNEELNRRFIWILIELLLKSMFPKNTISRVFDVHKR